MRISPYFYIVDGLKQLNKAGKPANWRVVEGSVLDVEHMAQFGEFDRFDRFDLTRVLREFLSGTRILRRGRRLLTTDRTQYQRECRSYHKRNGSSLHAFLHEGLKHPTQARVPFAGARAMVAAGSPVLWGSNLISRGV